MLKHKRFVEWYNQLMQQKEKVPKIQFVKGDRRAPTFVIIGVLLVVVALFLLLRPSERSVAAYCTEYKKQQAALPHGSNDRYKAAMFTSSVNDPHKFAGAFAALERVAPDDIRPDVKTLKSVFDKIDKDPSQTFGASLSGLGAETNVEKWTQDHCK